MLVRDIGPISDSFEGFSYRLPGLWPLLHSLPHPLVSYGLWLFSQTKPPGVMSSPISRCHILALRFTLADTTCHCQWALVCGNV
jgi:hypothetical protein